MSPRSTSPHPATPRAFATAAVAGCVAAVPMLAFMEILKRPGTPVPPHRIALRLGAVADLPQHMTPAQRTTFADLSHFAYGAAAAAPFGLLAPRHPGAAAAGGAAWGLAVWALSYVGWLPVAGILPPPWRRSRRRNALIIGGHLLWGAAMGTLAAAERERLR